jgi:hypothetical protein
MSSGEDGSMPLRDPFHPPLANKTSWEELHGGWPAVIVQQLRTTLPPGYVAGPRIGGTELHEYDEYEVRVYDATRGRRLVAAIELVSPGNKDRVGKRNAFVGKCAALLQNGVAVSIIDVVTTRPFNLYAELMAFIEHPDPTMRADQPLLYAASCRWVRGEERALLESWSEVLAVGQPLPKLPLWLADALVVPLDLEESYEKTCRDLWIE